MALTHTPVTLGLIIAFSSMSLLSGLLVDHADTPYAGNYILLDRHIWQHGQVYRFLTFQLVWQDASEMLFGSLALYTLRVVERFWGSRKYASFVLTSTLLTSLLTALAFIPLSAASSLLLPRIAHGKLFNYIPSGPISLIFALMVQYHEMVPALRTYRLICPNFFAASSINAASNLQQRRETLQQQTTSSTTATTNTPTTASSTTLSTATPDAAAAANAGRHSRNDDLGSFSLSDKTPMWIPPLHLLLSSVPASPVLALLGCSIGYLHRMELVPGGLLWWQLPRWFVGDSSSRRGTSTAARGKNGRPARRGDASGAGASKTSARVAPHESTATIIPTTNTLAAQHNVRRRGGNVHVNAGILS